MRHNQNHHSTKGTIKESEDKPLITKTIHIKGMCMLCSECAINVKLALERLPQVKSVKINHWKGTAVVKLKDDIPDEELKSVVESFYYSVISIE